MIVAAQIAFPVVFATELITLSPFHVFQGGDPLGQFAIEHIQNEWKVSVRKPLDREEKDNYLLNITASDGIFTAKATVEVKVLDANDNSPVCEKVKQFPPFSLPPEFKDFILLPCGCVIHSRLVTSTSQSLYSESVPENSQTGRLILQVSAMDADIRSNAHISYELQGPGSELFLIDPNTGMRCIVCGVFKKC